LYSLQVSLTLASWGCTYISGSQNREWHCWKVAIFGIYKVLQTPNRPNWPTVFQKSNWLTDWPVKTHLTGQ
jgi:hypothetical protein